MLPWTCQTGAKMLRSPILPRFAINVAAYLGSMYAISIMMSAMNRE